MLKSNTSHKRARAVGSALFLLGLAIVVFSGNYWPGIMLAIGISLGVRQYLLGHMHDMWVTALVFVGTFVMV